MRGVRKYDLCTYVFQFARGIRSVKESGRWSYVKIRLPVDYIQCQASSVSCSVTSAGGWKKMAKPLPPQYAVLVLSLLAHSAVPLFSHTLQIVPYVESCCLVITSCTSHLPENKTRCKEMPESLLVETHSYVLHPHPQAFFGIISYLSIQQASFLCIYLRSMCT